MKAAVSHLVHAREIRGPYRSFATHALLRPFVDQVLNWYNTRVLSEDRRVVLSQRPGAPARSNVFQSADPAALLKEVRVVVHGE